MHILIAEPDATLAALVTSACQGQGYVTACVASLPALYHNLEHSLPDVLICAAGLLDDEAAPLFASLHQEVAPAVYVIAVLDPQRPQPNFLHEADLVLLKPFSLRALLNRLRSLEAKTPY
ncbi:MAG: response regulator transcription factor [Anaerolineae bacterium]|nr:response regulator transcription factor [Anaerolineae bacterium]